MNYPNLGRRFILNKYNNKLDYYHSHYPLLGIIYNSHRSKGRLLPPWQDNYAYTLGVI